MSEMRQRALLQRWLAGTAEIEGSDPQRPSSAVFVPDRAVPGRKGHPGCSGRVGEHVRPLRPLGVSRFEQGRFAERLNDTASRPSSLWSQAKLDRATANMG